MAFLHPLLSPPQADGSTPPSELHSGCAERNHEPLGSPQLLHTPSGQLAPCIAPLCHLHPATQGHSLGSAGPRAGADTAEQLDAFQHLLMMFQHSYKSKMIINLYIFIYIHTVLLMFHKAGNNVQFIGLFKLKRHVYFIWVMTSIKQKITSLRLFLKSQINYWKYARESVQTTYFTFSFTKIKMTLCILVCLLMRRIQALKAKSLKHLWSVAWNVAATFIFFL